MLSVEGSQVSVSTLRFCLIKLLFCGTLFYSITANFQFRLNMTVKTRFHCHITLCLVYIFSMSCY